MPPELRQALRLLLLPERAGREDLCGQALANFFAERQIPYPDVTSWVSLELNQWAETGAPTKALQKAVAAVLSAADEDIGNQLGDRYFKLHAQLMRSHQMSHSEAVGFLSHSFLMIDLATSEGLSAAQVAKLTSGRDQRVGISRQSVAALLSTLGRLPELKPDSVKELFAQDSQAELPTFADADLPTAADMVAEGAAQLGFPGDLGSALGVLKLTEHTPYLQILHYQCVIAEFYDHAVTDLYEFRPRGTAGNWIFQQYPAALAGNPFLNNAKAVERVDASWVRSRKTAERQAGARALLSILVGLEQMGYAARRELARLLRLWLCRAIRLSQPDGAAIPERLSLRQIQRVLQFVRAGNTSTFGIFEQRVVDSIASLLHPEEKDWRGRGLLDSVNATNLSQRKFGDCDFQHVRLRQIEAYESHGGALTDTYVREHFRTLRKAIRLREQELLGIAELTDWQVRVTFVAHEVVHEPEPEIVIEGLQILTRAVTFNRFIADALQLAQLGPAFERFFRTPLSRRTTPAQVRQRLLELLSG